MSTQQNLITPLDGCTCKNRVFRFRIHSNDTKHWGTQCLNCGKFFYCKKAEVPALELQTAGEYEPSISEQYEAKMHALWREQSKAKREEDHQLYLDGLQEYYQTDDWKFKRKARLRVNHILFKGFCEMCFKNPAEQVHHMTYERIGNEWIFDLAAVCKSCHRAMHPHMDSEDGNPRHSI